MKPAPTVEEFTERVKEYFRDGWRTLSDKEVDEYIYGEEAQEEIQGRYAENKRDYENGKITYDVFIIGCAVSVAECLILMY